MAFSGILLALVERARTGRGQVVDAAMVDGAALLGSAQLAEYNDGVWNGLGTSLLSGQAPFYGVYECADGGWFAIGAIEPQFYDAAMGILGLDPDGLPDRNDARQWPQLRKAIAAVFISEPRDHWVARFAETDTCGSAVLEFGEL